MPALFTIGYEKAALSDFLATLQHNAIDSLLDVRELPISRRKGFSKNVLREAVETAGIRYQHEKRLGAPKWLRDQLKHDHDYKIFFKRYKEHLTQQNDLLEQLAHNWAGRVALVCYERSYHECHRSIIAEALIPLINLQPIHLKVALHESQSTRHAVRLHSGQSVPTTQSIL